MTRGAILAATLSLASISGCAAGLDPLDRPASGSPSPDDDAAPGDDDTVPPPETCDDGVDDDGDGRVDCMDDDCALHPGCAGECLSAGMLGCGDAIEAATDGFLATDAVDAWSCAAADTSGPELGFTFDAESAVRVTFRLTAAADLSLFVLSAASPCTGEACLAGGSAEVAIDGEAGASYRVIVEGRDGASGAFTLAADCAEPTPEDCGNGVDDDGDGHTDCADPDCEGQPACADPGCTPDIEITCDQYDDWSNDGPGSTDVIDSWPCSSWDESGPEYAYRFLPDRSGTAVVTLSGLSADLDLAVLDGTGAPCDPAACLGIGDIGASIPVSAGDVYTLVVDGYQGAVSDYRLTVDCE